MEGLEEINCYEKLIRILLDVFDWLIDWLNGGFKIKKKLIKQLICKNWL